MSESNHWYNAEGKPVHTVAGKTVDTRPTNIRDARELNLFPSVSGIIKQWYNPNLERYKIEKAMETARSYLSQYPVVEFDSQEEEDAYYKFVRENAKKESGNAADLGTKIHATIEAALDGYEWNQDEEVTSSEGYLVPIKEFVLPAIEVLKGFAIRETETVVLNKEDGYAGTMDVAAFKDGKNYILDFKSTKTKIDKKIEVRQGHAMQLAAYYKAFYGNTEDINAGNIYISTNEIGRVDLVIYTREELLEQWEAFKACLTLWRLANDYDPRTAAQ